MNNLKDYCNKHKDIIIEFLNLCGEEEQFAFGTDKGIRLINLKKNDKGAIMPLSNDSKILAIGQKV